MPTIDKLPDYEISTSYALRILLLEEVKRKADETRVADLTIVSYKPTYTDLETVMGVVQGPQAYASFHAPEDFYDMRRNPFTTFSVGPSFGSVEKRNAYENLIESTACPTAQDAAEKNTLLSCWGVVKKLDDMVSFISGRKGQFLQG
jgi:hypothetical protein